jgi:hypothetical protein
VSSIIFPPLLRKGASGNPQTQKEEDAEERSLLTLGVFLFLFGLFEEAYGPLLVIPIDYGFWLEKNSSALNECLQEVALLQVEVKAGIPREW